jgi:hypothetical protein
MYSSKTHSEKLKNYPVQLDRYQMVYIKRDTSVEGQIDDNRFNDLTTITTNANNACEANNSNATRNDITVVNKRATSPKRKLADNPSLTLIV